MPLRPENISPHPEPGEGGGEPLPSLEGLLPVEEGQAAAPHEQPESAGVKYELTPEQIKAREEMVTRLRQGRTDALEIRDQFNLPQEIVQDPEVQAAAKEGLVILLKEGQVDEALKIRDEFNLPPEIIQDPEVQAAAKEAMVDQVKHGSAHDALEIRYQFNLPQEVLFAAAKEVMVDKLKRWNVDYALEIRHQFNLPEEVVFDAAREGMVYRLKREEVDEALDIRDEFYMPEEVLFAAVKEGMVDLLKRGEVSSVIHIYHQFNSPEELVFAAAKVGMDAVLKEGRVFHAIKIRDELNLPDPVEDGSLPAYIFGFCDLFDIRRLEDFARAQEVFFSFICKTEQAPLISKADLPVLEKFHLSYIEAEEIKRGGADLRQLAEREDFPGLYDNLKHNSEDWQDEQNIQSPFEQGAARFGFERMFAYRGSFQSSLHDSFHAFGKILDLAEVSGLTPDQFYNNILAQVAKDGATYEAGLACHQLNTIAQTLSREFGQTIELAQRYAGIPRLQELASHFKNPRQIFASWNNLKRYSELAQLLRQSEMLDELKELKGRGKGKLYHYVETLAFHPASKVDMQWVTTFWRQPQAFLEAEDSHTPAEIHSRKKPSNYVHIPNLDLTATDVRDALVEGDLDKLQAFTPMQVSYTFEKAAAERPGDTELIRQALGSQKDGVAGLARNTRKLFSELNKLLQPSGMNVSAVLEGAALPSEPDFDEKLEGLLYHKDFGLPKSKTEKLELVAEIHAKSDPEGVLAGNDTACCMPFGSGKNTVYMFNPDTAQFTVRLRRPDGTYRTIAQSVLTKDRDIKRPIPEILADLNAGKHKLNEVVPEDVLQTAESLIACDNVEVAPNYKAGEYSGRIETVYRDFFAEYLKRYAKAQGLQADRVIVGQGYSDTLTHLPEVPNTFAPLAPVGYSDKTGAKVYQLEVRQPLPRLKRKVRAPELPGPPAQVSPGRGTAPLTFADTLPVAYLEGKAYSENETLMEYLHNMENALIAKDINNTAKQRPNLSFKYTDASGKVRGYLLAYEGRRGGGRYRGQAEAAGEEEYEESEAAGPGGERVIYIADLAAEAKNIAAGGALVIGFVEAYKKNYLEKGQLVPIYTQAREQTSYRLIQRQLERLSAQLGMQFELEELGTYRAGKDTMHELMIRPLKT